jgi:hypothetical protein
MPRSLVIANCWIKQRKIKSNEYYNYSNYTKNNQIYYKEK